MFDSNPNLVQDGPQQMSRQNAIPLVLIHDGGGTIFSYHLLGDLDRKVWAIANPRFRSETHWTGGLREMATAYAAFVAEAVPSGPVILGGWSLGGLLALETAHVLSQIRPSIHVAGLVMVDSVCPVPPEAGWGGAETRLAERDIEWPATTAAATKICVERCFREAHRMVREWTPPVSRPPLAVLIRCREPVLVPHDGLLYIDLYRDDQRLGWDNHRKDMFCQILEAPGHHYNIFALEHVDTVTAIIKTACEAIEQQNLASDLS
ncbi:hypothetical protein SBRCBS47491_005133 [Sporothrix bragantina]|uniref:Thioesterase TesA-like domain-containing protein n=1 Tax=Sporothrix bragantina TaxID=671064 RepID=A0ABP0BUP7_9PEZI